MRKIIALLTLLFLSSSLLLAQNTNFRDASWGMTKSEVKETENQQLLQEKTDVLYYSDKLEGQQMYVVYKFEGEEKQLTQGQYILQSDLESESQYINFYESLESTMQNQYGTPRVDTTLVQSKQYMNNPEKYPEALQSGDVRFQTSWKTDATEIVMQLWNGSKGIQLAVQYIGTNM